MFDGSFKLNGLKPVFVCLWGSCNVILSLLSVNYCPILALEQYIVRLKIILAV